MGIDPIAIGVNFILPMLMGKQQGQQQQETDDLPNGLSPSMKALLSIKRKDGSVTVLIGGREVGKTNAWIRLAEFFGRPTYAITPEEAPPKWVRPVSLRDIGDIVIVPPKSTLAVDDMPVVASSRMYHDTLVQMLEQIVPMCRHERKLHLIFATQNAAQCDKFVLDADMVLLKPLSVLGEALERPAVWKIYRDKVNPVFYGKSDMWVKTHAYCITRGWEGTIEIGKV